VFSEHFRLWLIGGEAKADIVISSPIAPTDLTQVTNPDGSVVLYQYDPKFHKVTQTTDADGNKTSAVYDQTTAT
jgi:YD repeat-containing protein